MSDPDRVQVRVQLPHDGPQSNVYAKITDVGTGRVISWCSWAMDQRLDETVRLSITLPVCTDHNEVDVTGEARLITEVAGRRYKLVPMNELCQANQGDSVPSLLVQG